jgi:hypothetical protein
MQVVSETNGSIFPTGKNILFHFAPHTVETLVFVGVPLAGEPAHLLLAVIPAYFEEGINGLFVGL